MLAIVLNTVLTTTAARVMHYDISVFLKPEQQQMTVDSVVLVPSGTLSSPEMPISLGEQMGVPELLLNGEPVEPTRTEEAEGVMGNKVVRYIKVDPKVDNRITARYTTVKATGFVYMIAKGGSFASGSNTDWYPSTGGRVVSSTITVSVPKGEVVKATGRLVKTEETDSRTVYTFDSPAAATLSFVAGPYKVYRDDSGKLPVALYLFKERPFTEKAVQMLRDVADELEEWFGPYPFSEMAIVEVDPIADTVAGFGGAALEGFLLAVPNFIDGDGAGPNLAFIGHELGHSWWGHQVKQAGETGKYMVTEAMAQFGSLKAVEAIDGPALAVRYRKTGYPGYIPEQSGRGALQTMRGGYDPPLARLTGRQAHGFSDGKGFQIYHQLEQVIGTEKLKNAFHQLQKEYAWQRINSEKMFELIGESAGVDLAWFYDQWFERPGAPRWDVGWHQEGNTLVVDIDQQGEQPYRFVTELEAVFTDGTKKRWPVDMRQDHLALKFPVAKKVESVWFDPDWDVFHWDPDLVDLRDDGVKEASLTGT